MSQNLASLLSGSTSCNKQQPTIKRSKQKHIKIVINKDELLKDEKEVDI